MDVLLSNTANEGENTGDNADPHQRESVQPPAVDLPPRHYVREDWQLGDLVDFGKLNVGFSNPLDLAIRLLVLPVTRITATQVLCRADDGVRVYECRFNRATGRLIGERNVHRPLTNAPIRFDATRYPLLGDSRANLRLVEPRQTPWHWLPTQLPLPSPLPGVTVQVVMNITLSPEWPRDRARSLTWLKMGQLQGTAQQVVSVRTLDGADVGLTPALAEIAP